MIEPFYVASSVFNMNVSVQLSMHNSKVRGIGPIYPGDLTYLPIYQE